MTRRSVWNTLTCGVVLLLSGDRLSAGETWTWHVFDFVPVKTARVEWTLHSRVRINGGELQQGRSGTILKVNVSPRVSTIGGYYYGRETDSFDDWKNFHRIFGGLEVPVYRTRRGTVTGRSLVERFFPEDRSRYNRYRHRARFASNGRVGPFAQVEWFFDNRGFLSTRYSGGVRWRPTREAVIECGYLYEARTARLGADRHVIVTSVTLERAKHHAKQ